MDTDWINYFYANQVLHIEYVGLQHGEDTSVTRILRLFSNCTKFHHYVQKCLSNTVQKNGVRSM